MPGDVLFSAPQPCRGQPPIQLVDAPLNALAVRLELVGRGVALCFERLPLCLAVGCRLSAVGTASVSRAPTAYSRELRSSFGSRLSALGTAFPESRQPRADSHLAMNRRSISVQVALPATAAASA